MDEQQLIELGQRLVEAFNTSDWATYSAAMLEASNDGKVVALREYYDRAAIMAQLGIGAPAPAPTS